MVENYPEFNQDIKEIWEGVISKHNFKLKKLNDSKIILYNEKVIISFLLDVDSRMGYIIENKHTGVVYDEISLHMYKNIPMIYNSYNKESYPLTKDEWFDLFAEDDYRAICLIDIPIIRDEIITKWPELVVGDFSKEKEYIEWLEWRRQKKNKRKSFDELTYKNYLKIQEG